MCFRSKISRDKLYNKNYEPDETIDVNSEETETNDDYKSITILIGTIYLDKGGQNI